MTHYYTSFPIGDKLRLPFCKRAISNRASRRVSRNNIRYYTIEVYKWNTKNDATVDIDLASSVVHRGIPVYYFVEWGSMYSPFIFDAVHESK